MKSHTRPCHRRTCLDTTEYREAIQHTQSYAGTEQSQAPKTLSKNSCMAINYENRSAKALWKPVEKLLHA